jgi:MFS family permease
MNTQDNSQNAEAVPALPPTPLSMREVLRIPTMRRLWYAQIVSVFGDFLALFAVIIVMTFNLHANAQQITGVQIAYMLPIAVLGVLSGVFVDRWPVKPTLVSSDLIRALLCLGLFAVHTVWGFYLVLAAISVLSSFFSPAQGVALRSAVPHHGLGSSQALMQQVMMGMRIVGGPIATGLVAALGPRFCYGVDALSFIASATLIGSLAISLPEAHASAISVIEEELTGLRRIGRDIKQGVSFIVHHAAVFFVIMALAAGMFVIGCFGPLIAIYVRDNLHGAKGTFGLTSPMIPLGMVLGMNIIVKLSKNRKATALVYFGLGGIGLGTLLLAMFPHLYAVIPGLFLIGFSAAAIIVPAQTLIAQETPLPMMGRVGSTVMSAIFSAQITGLILSGILTQHTSVRRVFAISTAMLAVLIVAGKLWMEPKPNVSAA